MKGVSKTLSRVNSVLGRKYRRKVGKTRLEPMTVNISKEKIEFEVDFGNAQF